MIAKGFTTGEIMVCLVINGDKLPQGEKLVTELRKVDGMTNISISKVNGYIIIFHGINLYELHLILH